MLNIDPLWQSRYGLINFLMFVISFFAPRLTSFLDVRCARTPWLQTPAIKG